MPGFALQSDVRQNALSLPSFAKINWSLEILGRRTDGYHEIRTLLQTISLHDDLHFELTDDGTVSLSCDDPNLPTDHGNLVVRAANALKPLKQRQLIAGGARIRLEKRIPSQAGLGGASSNAAISLLALSHLWRLEVTAAKLLEIAATLGADVPFFLLGGTARATGTGTTVSSIPEDVDNAAEAGETACRHLIVITPNAGVSTVAAYAAVNSRALTTENADTILSVSRGGAESRYSQLWPPDSLKNDFESVIFDSEPEIRRAKETLLQAGALGALLAGSGSSVFGIFADRKDQQRAVSEMKLEAGWRIFPCVTVSRNEYVQAIGSLSIPFLRSFNFGSDIGA